jgi:hypothetical protein
MRDLWYKRDRTGKLLVDPMYPELRRLADEPSQFTNFTGTNKCHLNWPSGIKINGKSMSRNEISKLTGIDRPRIGRIFGGKAGVNADTLTKIATVFEVTAQQLAGIFSGHIHPDNLLPIMAHIGSAPVTIEGAQGSPTIRVKDIGPSWGHGFKD